jgi:hypothetical protein
MTHDSALTCTELIIGVLFISFSATVTPDSLRHVVLPALGLVAGAGAGGPAAGGVPGHAADQAGHEVLFRIRADGRLDAVTDTSVPEPQPGDTAVLLAGDHLAGAADG